MLSLMAALAALLCLLLAVAGLFKPALLGQKRRQDVGLVIVRNRDRRFGAVHARFFQQSQSRTRFRTGLIVVITVFHCHPYWDFIAAQAASNLAPAACKACWAVVFALCSAATSVSNLLMVL